MIVYYAVTFQSTATRKSAVVLKDGKSGARFWHHDTGVKVDEMSMRSCLVPSGLRIYTVRIVTCGAWYACGEMSAVPSAGSGGWNCLFSKTHIAQNAVTIMTPVAKRVVLVSLRRLICGFVAFFQNRSKGRAMRAFGSAGIIGVTIRAIKYCGYSHVRIQVGWNAWYVEVFSRTDYRMVGNIGRIEG